MACSLICGSFMLLNSGCIKSVFGDGTITIKGRLVQDCSEAPIAGKPLNFSLNIGGSKTGGRTEVIGTDTTDAEGNFSVIAKNFGDGYLKVEHDPGGPQYYSYAGCVIEGDDGSTVDLGIVYYKFDHSVSVQFFRPANSAGDTLYFGNSINQPIGSAVGAEINGYVYHVDGQMNGSLLPYAKETKWVWGIGMADYQNAVDSMNSISQTQEQNPPYDRIFKARLGVCKDDTSIVHLSH